MLPRLDRYVSMIPRLSRASAHTIAGEEALDRWIGQKKGITLSETLHTDRVSDLYITLPTRDGTRRPYAAPMNSEPLGFGHHLAFFHPRTPETDLRPDGTEAHFCPPSPSKSLIIGGKASARTSVSSVHKKGFDGACAVPMVFVNQRIEIVNEGEKESAVLEERTHVHRALGDTRDHLAKVRWSLKASLRDLPPPDFSLNFTPSPTSLFRFSALTFNGHHIHLDRDYAQESEGYPALMLLETLVYHHPEAQMKSFEYRALNPVIVNRELNFHGCRSSSKEIVLWVQDEAGVVGMKGRVSL
ncbi:hypothetical protein BJV74DRAFT_875213 [Russula compacta]|nr:hypothetical protein BJV74DRAFT_875213 [Russula compacta]